MVLPAPITKVKCDKTLNFSSRWYLHLDMSLISKNLMRMAGKHLLGTWLRDPGPGKKTWFIVFFPSLYTSFIPFLFFWSLMKTAKSFFSFFEGFLSQVHNSHDPGKHSQTAQKRWSNYLHITCFSSFQSQNRICIYVLNILPKPTLQ